LYPKYKIFWELALKRNRVQVKGDDPDKKGYPGPPGWGLGHGADNPIPINNNIVRKPANGPKDGRG
jgi:hypothetical protein